MMSGTERMSMVYRSTLCTMYKHSKQTIQQRSKGSIKHWENKWFQTSNDCIHVL